MKFELFTAFIFFSLQTKAQQSIVTSGGDSKSEFGSTSFTIGEVFYVSKGLLFSSSEGLQHTYVIKYTSSEYKVYISIFPNPTKDLIYFKLINYNYLDLSYILYDLTGKILIKGKITNTHSFISLKEFPPQTYILKCYRGNSDINVFKIIKEN